MKLEQLGPGGGLGGGAVHEHDPGGRARRGVRALDVVRPLHAAPVRGLHPQLQPRQLHSLGHLGRGQVQFHAESELGWTWTPLSAGESNVKGKCVITLHYTLYFISYREPPLHGRHRQN